MAYEPSEYGFALAGIVGGLALSKTFSNGPATWDEMGEVAEKIKKAMEEDEIDLTASSIKLRKFAAATDDGESSGFVVIAEPGPEEENSAGWLYIYVAAEGEYVGRSYTTE
jgi:hypothetical protein